MRGVSAVSSTLWSRRRRVTTAAIGTVALVLTGLAGIPSAGAQAFPGEDEVVSSPNMTMVAHLPPTDPLAGDASVGTDMAFQGDFAFVGNYLGVTIYNIKNPKKPKIVSQVLCPGSQNDVSVSGNLLFLSTDSRRSDNSCNSVPQNNGALPYWEGMKIFDISDKRAPRYVQSIDTDCGSHTHTLVPDSVANSGTVYLYVSSYSPNAALPRCQPPHDYISIIKVPVDNPAAARVIAKPVLFPDGGNPGDGQPFPNGTSTTSGCHDLTVYPEKNLMAGACMGDGVLFDITNREAPRTLSRVEDDANFAFWHSATFNNEGTKVIFTDELGGGGAATCNPQIGPLKGADGVYDVVGQGDARQLEFRSYFKISRTQADNENCVAHNGSLIPVRGKDIMVQAWYQGGMQVWDFTDSAHPQEIGFLERGPLADGEVGGEWSVYWYNGFIFGSDIVKGFDVVELNDSRTNPARGVKFSELNVQTQRHFDR
ncbi:MAG: LVIVD repeat-containing protein [Labedaea sp.]